jgi:hypothetical protein
MAGHISLLLVLVLLIFCRIAPALSLAPAAVRTAHVFLLAGQSNAEGSNSDGLLPVDAPTPRILQLSCCAVNGSSLPPSDCFLNISSDPMMPCIGAHGLSFARPFARALLPSLPATDVVVIVPAPIGGTGFGDGTWTAYTGWGFVPAVEKLRRAWSLLHGSDWQGWNVTLDGVLWHQGEMDAGDNSRGYVANSSHYLTDGLLPMIAALRNTSYLPFSSPQLPFVNGQMLPQWLFNSSHPERLGVGQAEALLPQHCAYTGHADSFGLLGDPLYRSGWDNSVIHFTASSQRIFGQRYHTAYRAALLNYPDVPPSDDRGSEPPTAAAWGDEASPVNI